MVLKHDVSGSFTALLHAPYSSSSSVWRTLLSCRSIFCVELELRSRSRSLLLLSLDSYPNKASQIASDNRII